MNQPDHTTTTTTDAAGDPGTRPYTDQEWQAACERAEAAGWDETDEETADDPAARTLCLIYQGEEGSADMVRACLIAASEIHGAQWTSDDVRELAGAVVPKPRGWADLGEEWADDNRVPLALIGRLVAVGQCTELGHAEYPSAMAQQEAGLAEIGRQYRRTTEVYALPHGDDGPMWIFTRPDANRPGATA